MKVVTRSSTGARPLKTDAMEATRVMRPTLSNCSSCTRTPLALNFCAMLTVLRMGSTTLYLTGASSSAGGEAREA